MILETVDGDRRSIIGTIGVAIPTIPPREYFLARARRSVDAQTLKADAVAVAVDRHGDGAAATRNIAWRALETDWVAFLDDDDELLPHHLEHLATVAHQSGADMVYPWHTIIGPELLPLPDLLRAQGKPFDPWELFGGDPALIDAEDFTAGGRNFIPINVLVRRELLEQAGGFAEVRGGEATNEDWLMWRRLVKLGAEIVHTPEVTWHWHHHRKNTSGRADRWAVGHPSQTEAPL